MGQAWRRWGGAALVAIGLSGLTAVPAAATNTYPYSGPLEIRIFGANGALRDFVARSAADRLGATALLGQVTGALQGPAQPIEDAAATFPHYRIGVSRLGPTYVTNPWARTSETSFIYYPGRQGTSFLVIQFNQGNAALQQRWILASPEVASLLQRHLQGLPPIGLAPASRATVSEPWGMAVGVLLLTGFGLMLFEDRRRLIRQRRSAGKGTDRRSRVVGRL